MQRKVLIRCTQITIGYLILQYNEEASNQLQKEVIHRRRATLQLVSRISKLTLKKFRFVKEEEIFSPFRKSCKVVACVKLSNKWRQLKNTVCEK